MDQSSLPAAAAADPGTARPSPGTGPLPIRSLKEAGGTPAAAVANGGALAANEPKRETAAAAAVPSAPAAAPRPRGLTLLRSTGGRDVFYTWFDGDKEIRMQLSYGDSIILQSSPQ